MFILKMYGGLEATGRQQAFELITNQINMKKLKISATIFALALIMLGCEKAKDPAGLRDVGLIPVISDVNPGIFDSRDLKNSYVELTIGLDNGKKADKAIIEGSYNNNHERVKLLEITTFPATVRIISGDVIQKLGIAEGDVVNGDTFILEVVTTANGLTTRSTAILRVVVSCAYDRALASGSYHSASTDWNSDGDITITADPADPYKVYVTGLEEMEGLVEDSGPLVMYINPATYEVTVPSKVISSNAWGYGSISYAGTGVYNSCDGSYVMHFDISLESLGSQGINTFIFTRNPN
jgi:hypothetical protein